ncbi:MAG: hypothetical protein WC828_00700 [Thermoleophilia bacterium]
MATGTSHYHLTRKVESRVSRLDRRSNPKGDLIRKPFLNASLELKTVFVYAGLLASMTAALVLLPAAGLIDPESDARLILAFSLGIVITCALSSSLAFLIALRHRVLLIAGSALFTTAGAIIVGLTPLEGLAKVLFATSLGLWISLILTSVGQVLLISLLIVLVDFYSVFLGPTKKMVESGGPWLEYLTVSMPVFGASGASRIGAADIIFFSIFTGCTLTYRLRRTTTALAMTLSFVSTMVIGVRLDIGVPALPLLSIFFLLSNADLLYRRFLEEPDEHKKKRDA